MFDIGWTELLLIGIVALIVVGPKDLPGMFRTLGRFTGKMRGMAREFQRSMDEAADSTGMRDVARDLRKAASPHEMGLDALKKATRFDDDEGADADAAATRAGTLSAEREDARRKIAERTAATARARREAEAKAAEETAAAAPDATDPAPAAPDTKGTGA